MRMIALGMVLLVGCGNMPGSEVKQEGGKGGGQQLAQKDLEKWQGEWVSTKDSPLLKLRIKGEQVTILDIGDLATTLDGENILKDFRIRLLPRKTNDFYQFDLVHKSRIIYYGICIYRNDGSIELSMSFFGRRPTEMQNAVIINKKR